MAVTLDVGGMIYKTSLATLTSHPDTFFTEIFTGDWINTRDEVGNIFIDRKGKPFEYILEFLRNGQAVVLPNDKLSLAQIRCEANFYRLMPLLEKIDREDGDRVISLRFTGTIEFSTTITLSQMRSAPGSYFSQLANDITSNTMEKDTYAMLTDDGSYEVNVDKISVKFGGSKLESAANVCEVLKFGRSIGMVSVDAKSDLLPMAKVLGVPEAVQFASEVEEKRYPNTAANKGEELSRLV